MKKIESCFRFIAGLSLLLFSFCCVSANEDRVKTLSLLFDSIRSSNSDSFKIATGKRVLNIFKDELSDPNSFSDPFDSLSYVGKVLSDDGKLRVYTWCFQLSDYTFEYGCAFQYKKSSKEVSVSAFTTNGKAFLPQMGRKYSQRDWYGALYYKVIRVKKDDYYILLGWGGNNSASDFKVIEPIMVDSKGSVRFGKPVLKDNAKVYFRQVLEYSAEAKVSLTYDEQFKRVVFDHLVPMEPAYTNIRSYYGPDFTYDAYSLKKGKWIFESNIDAKNE